MFRSKKPNNFFATCSGACLNMSNTRRIFWGPARDMASRALSLLFLAMLTSSSNAIDGKLATQAGMPLPQSSESNGASGNSAPPAAPAEVVFDAARRAVSDWPAEAIDNLDLSAKTKVEMASKIGTPEFPRCVMLNNYWCIKRARWAGEIAADTEGHVAFASAIDGATAAAMLLRRYYLDYNLRSALAILSRWAPPQCAVAARSRLADPGNPVRLASPRLLASPRVAFKTRCMHAGSPRTGKVFCMPANQWLRAVPSCQAGRWL
jgi:hypothetical protein